MATTSTKSTEQRKARRQPRSLRISWRVLGNRDFSYGAAALRDISTDGLAMQVDQYCRKGTVVIVQFDSVVARLAEPMLLQAQWCNELPPTKDGTPTYVVGCSFSSPLSAQDLQALLESSRKAAAAPAPPKEGPAKTSAPVDPFLDGSAGEKRSTARRKGLTVPVVLWREEGTRIEGLVVDRSLRGLGILIPMSFVRGTLLKVRPRDAHDKTVSVEVEVRHCRQKGKEWFLGCQFQRTPPVNILMQLG